MQQFHKVATTNGASLNDVAGFIVNTANYSPTKEPYLKITDSVGGQTARQSKWLDWNQYADEQSFAQAMRDKLVAAGFGMLIDTFRNGWGGSARPRPRPDDLCGRLRRRQPHRPAHPRRQLVQPERRRHR